MPSGTYIRTKEIREKNRTSQSIESRRENTKKSWTNERKAAHRIFMMNNFHHSIDTKARLSEIGKTLLAEKNPNWKGGVTPEHIRIRNSLEMAEWRQKVFERDNWTCQICLKRGVYLHADHIQPFAFFPELRFDIDNGRTLCVECHKNTDTYAGRVWAWMKKQNTVLT